MMSGVNTPVPPPLTKEQQQVKVVEYLASHPEERETINTMVEAILKDRPEDMHTFVIEYLRALQEGNLAAPATKHVDAMENTSFSKKRPTCISLDTASVEPLTSESAKALLSDAERPSVVVDCRDNDNDFSVPCAVRVTVEASSDVDAALIAPLIAKFGESGPQNFLFLSKHSPDLDQEVARAFAEAMRSTRPVSCFTVVGGAVAWLAEFGHDDKYVQRAAKTRKHLPLTELLSDAALEVSRLSVESAATLLRDHSFSTVLFDCRANRKGGSVPGAELLNDAQLMDEASTGSELATKYGPNTSVTSFVFMSRVSPDVDERLATAFIRAMDEKFPDRKRESYSVSIVIGGATQWFRENAKESELVADFDSNAWENSLLPSDSFIRRAKKTVANIEVVESQVESLHPEVVAELLGDADTKVTVFDVRLQQTRAVIPGCTHLPLGSRPGCASSSVSEVAAEYIKAREKDEKKQKASNAEVVVFVSAVSPDIDYTCASEFAEVIASSETGSEEVRVAILLGGMNLWVAEHSADCALCMPVK